MRIACLTHVPFEGPAGIAEWAAQRGHEFEVFPVFRDDHAHPGEADMVVVMGGPMNIYEHDEHPWLLQEKAYLESVARDGTTLCLGVCLGAQLLADVLGGSVTRGQHREIGWYPVELTEQGRTLGITDSLPERFEALHWHGDTFAIPPDAVNLARSEGCENQAFAYDGGRVLGLQFHLETTPESLGLMVGHMAHEADGQGEWVSTADELADDESHFDQARELMWGLLDALAARRVQM